MLDHLQGQIRTQVYNAKNKNEIEEGPEMN
jgi:hypothetical protein